MTPRTQPWLLALLALLAAAANLPAQEFFFKKNDVVVIMGDSITEQRLYSNYVELWSQTRFPSYNLVFRNVGIGGDRSVGGNARFKRDVLTHKPTVLTVDFGMNDGNYNWVGKIVKSKDGKTKETSENEVDAAYQTYMKGQQGIADQAKAAGIRVAWITPQPVEHNPGEVNEQYNKTLEKFSAGVKEIAEKNGGLFVDQFHPYWAVIEKARKAGEKGRITAGDAVHPGPPGQALMAASILKGLGLPREVSSVSITIQGAQETAKCRIDKLGWKGDAGMTTDVAFTRTDAALPFFPEAAKSILKHAPLLEEMNVYELKIVGLAPGKFDVKLENVTVATVTSEELAKGANLASAVLAKGPIAEQVKDIVQAVTNKTNYYHGQIYSPLVLGRGIDKNPDLKDVAKTDLAKRRDALIEERMKRMPEFDAAIRKAVAPRTHRVVIVQAN